MELLDDSVNFEDYYNNLETKTKVVDFDKFKEKTIDLVWNPEVCNAPKTPWEKMQFQMRGGEVTVYCGFSGHGKTLITSQIALHLMQQHKKICIASFEMKGEATVLRMARQGSNTLEPSRDYIEKFCEWTRGWGYIYDVLGSSNPRVVEGVIAYCAKELGVEHFFIDSLTKVMEDTDNWNEQKQFVSRLTNLAQDLNIHIHLICHSRKKASEQDVPNKFDVAGASDITNLADNVFTIWRNKIKEDVLNDVYASEEDRNQYEKVPDCVISCEKQRHFDWEGKVGLWRDPNGNSFKEEETNRPYLLEFKSQVKSKITINEN